MVRRAVREAAVARGLDTQVALPGTDRSGGEAGIRIVLVGDHPLFRDGVRMALQGADGLRVIAKASSRDEAVELLFQRRIRTDVILVDLQMADRSGVDITRTVSERAVSGRSPEVPHVIAIGAEPDDDAVVAVLRAGARGYLLKNVAARELVWAIRIVADGGAVFSPPVAERLGGGCPVRAPLGHARVHPSERCRAGRRTEPWEA